MSPPADRRAAASVTLTVDGRLVSAREGETLLEVCREQGVPLPTLCHIDGLSDVGACRLCLVEVEGSTRLSAACVTRAAEGQVIRTDSERLRRYRRQIVELLFAERNHVCAICVANGKCELQSLAYAVGMDFVRYAYQYPRHEVDASHVRFVHDASRCILCTRCVRVCDEIEGAHTWDVGGRGAGCRVVTDLAQPWGASGSCTACGKCVQVCPTGALFEKERGFQTRKSQDFLTYLRVAREKKQWIR
ncbi:MAG TPA: bidirectional hydrogenase complex protein HoxU [Anaeromyxobacteraceae bacterium]|nr:bidirectional hydrogenase complex protein HoxU [Anaeromyxobacteraceae bacterium]